MLLADLQFAALLSYAPRGQSDEAKRAQNVMRALKGDTMHGAPPQPTSIILAQRLQRTLGTVPFADWFGVHVTLVPVPKSALMKPGTLWVPERLGRAMVDAGLARESIDLLRRTKAIGKAAFAATPADRPRAEDHYQTLAVEGVLGAPREILLVDDVITRGAAMLGAASRLADAFPEARIRGFAFIRTVSDVVGFAALEAPVVGTIHLYPSGKTHREP